ncbi:hypothetical protein JYU34_010827 [Plutella xylostella]|uniref:Uncharacterized protein n=1 Tax=Plutella xylostella TaxID=51655 RepID=A0ABQ7QGK1_PLUXY|nr:hypothetical protein JYU34_010827 [Plutella xylostella]
MGSKTGTSSPTCRWFCGTLSSSSGGGAVVVGTSQSSVGGTTQRRDRLECEGMQSVLSSLDREVLL